MDNADSFSPPSWLAAGPRARYGQVIDKFDLDSPHEVTLALRQTEGAWLGNFAEGWAEPGTPWNRAGACPEPHVLIRRELHDWPQEPDELRTLAFSLGARMEDAWGAPQRRFLANRGEHEGNFDPRTARWP
jgi:hypothetical protein